MAEIVNLRTKRKQAARDAARAAASQRNAAAGVNRAMHELAAARRVREEAALEGHRFESSGPDQPAGREKES